MVEFDPEQYEEYLEGWKIVHKEEIVFIKGDVKEAGLSWLNEIYGNLKPVEKDDKIFNVDGERKPLFMYYEEEKRKRWDRWDIHIDYDRIWSFFESYFDMEYEEIQDLIKVWLETYNLRGFTPNKQGLLLSIYSRLGETT